MAENNRQDYDDNKEYDAYVEALHYGTIEASSLFDPDDKSIKIGTGGYRIKHSQIIGAIIMLFLSSIISLLLWRLFGDQFFYLLPFLLVFVGLMTLLGLHIGNMSPTRKTTGEDLMTYIFMMIRKRIGSRSSIIFGRGPSKVHLNSLAVNKANGGRIIECEVYLGTQPVYDAPPINPYDLKEMSEFSFESSGEMQVLPTKDYDDGVRRKM